MFVAISASEIWIVSNVIENTTAFVISNNLVIFVSFSKTTDGSIDERKAGVNKSA
jgi:hypothetical protein